MVKRSRKSERLSVKFEEKTPEEIEEGRDSEEWVSVPCKEEVVLTGVLCPFCLRASITKPTLIHETTSHSPCVACESCVEEWQSRLEMNSEETFRCVLCEAKGPVTSLGGGEYVPTQYTSFKNVTLEEQKRETEPPKCGMCEEKSASLKCFQCNFSYCESCHQNTHSKGMFKTHTVVSLEEAKKTENKMCRTHTDKNLDLYCKDCALCVCVSCCFAGPHKSHDVVPLSDISKDARQSLYSIAAELQAHSERSHRVSQSVQESIPLYHDVVEKVTAELRETFQALIDNLKKREEALLHQLGTDSSVFQSELSRIKRLSESLNHTLSLNFDALMEIADNLHEVHLMRTLSGIEDNCKRIQSHSASVLHHLEKKEDFITQRLGERGALASFALLPGEQENTTAVVQYNEILSRLGSLKIATEVQEEATSTPEKITPAEEDEPCFLPSNVEDVSGEAERTAVLRTSSMVPLSELRFSNQLEIKAPHLRRTEAHPVENTAVPGLKLNWFHEASTDKPSLDFAPLEKRLKLGEDLALPTSYQPPSSYSSRVLSEPEKQDFPHLQLRL